MTKKVTKPEPTSPSSRCELKRQRAAQATLESGVALAISPRRMGELIYQARRARLIAEAEERAAPARRSRKPSR